MLSIRISLLLVLLVGNLTVRSQVIANQSWDTEEDYRNAEQNVLDNILWLEIHPLSTDKNDTKGITEYVLNWVSSTPYVAVKYDEIFLEGLTNSKKYKFGEKFRVTYLFGKTYYMLDNPDMDDEALACARGIQGMVKVYALLKKMDPSVKNRLLEKYSRLLYSNKLEDYTRDLLAKTSQS